MQIKQDSAIKAVLWDIDDVLVDTTAMYQVSRQCAFQALEVDASDIPKLLTIWDRLFWFFDQDDTEEILWTVLTEAGVVESYDLQRLQQAVSAYDAIWKDHIVPVEGIIDVIQYLAKFSILQAVVSNGSADYQTRKLDAIGLSSLFESGRVLIAEKTSPMAKPRPHGIRHMCHNLGVAPLSATYVGDRHSDVVAANLAGVRSILFRRTPASPEVLKPPVDGAIELERPKHLVESVNELANLLEATLGIPRN